jgi:hypothetical protein
MKRHNILERTKAYHSGDCYLYEAKCSCGEVVGGWSEQQSEQEVTKHLNKQVKMNNNNFKKGEWVIARWRGWGKETDIATVKNQINSYSFNYDKFYRIKDGVLHVTINDGRPLEINDYRYSLKWRKMTDKEKAKYLKIIGKKVKS